MTIPQALSFAIIVGMMVLFASDRIRYDLIAAVALCCGALTGIVPPSHVFEGFSNPVIIIIASVLVLSRAIAVSGAIEGVMRRIMRRIRSSTLQIGTLTAAVTLLSAVIKNIGTLGMFLPIAIQTAQRRKRPVSRYLMPLAFGSLVGGTITEIGTSPNLLIATVRQEVLGTPYHLFDFAPVGLPLSLVAIAFLSVGWRLLPQNRIGRAAAEKRFAIEDYMTEAVVPPASPFIGKTIADLEDIAEGEVTVITVIREHDRRYIPASHWTIFENDVLVLQADPVALRPVVDQAGLKLLGEEELAALKPRDKDDQLEVIEAVVSPDSPLVGWTPAGMHLRQSYELNLLAISRGNRRLATRLRHTRFREGDVVVLQGRSKQLNENLPRLGCLPLAERNLAIGRPRSKRLLPVIVMAGAMLLIAFGMVRAELGFFAAATLVVLSGVLTPKEALDAIDWPIVIMLACLIPVGEAVKDTGAAGLIADGLTRVAGQLPGYLAVGVMLISAMLITPMLHHAAAVLVMGPVAAAVAKNLGYGPDAFLMAVALGASCDFLTPIGHQNNLLVMGPGGYKFADYWRLGLPLSCIVAVFGTSLILIVWPLGSAMIATAR
ncbi:MAG: SLC13 family permease [Acetobacteraceae bacterium]|nr:SLC13 family permease [Acetobacteraceae bacterium]